MVVAFTSSLSAPYITQALYFLHYLIVTPPLSFFLHRRNNFYYYSHHFVMLSSRPSIQQPETGKKVGQYVFAYSDLIGKGNFARVYRGLHLPTNQTVAIKAVSLDALKSKRLQALVFQQIHILQLMDHPNVLRLREALLSQRNCYIVTELCPGGNLQQRIKRSPMSHGEIASVMLQLIEGLRYLRTMEVVHRDFKSANVFLSNGLVKIADFGLAKFYKERFHDLDIGSPQYMSPEGLIMNFYGEKTDVWGLGVILYEMVHGRTPFINCKEEKELKYWITRPLSDNIFRKDIHPCIKQLILKLMELDEGKRPSIADLAKDTLMEGLRELAKQEKGDSGKKKFSFTQRMESTGLFQKKPEPIMQTGMQVVPSMPRSDINKSMQLIPSQLRQNTSFMIKPSQIQITPLKPMFIPPQTDKNEEKKKNKFVFPNMDMALQVDKRSQFWQGESTKTNETKDSQDEEYKYLRINTSRSFWNWAQ